MRKGDLWVIIKTVGSIQHWLTVSLLIFPNKMDHSLQPLTSESLHERCRIILALKRWNGIYQPSMVSLMQNQSPYNNLPFLSHLSSVHDRRRGNETTVVVIFPFSRISVPSVLHNFYKCAIWNQLPMVIQIYLPFDPFLMRTDFHSGRYRSIHNWSSKHMIVIFFNPCYCISVQFGRVLLQEVG